MDNLMGLGGHFPRDVKEMMTTLGYIRVPSVPALGRMSALDLIPEKRKGLAGPGESGATIAEIVFVSKFQSVRNQYRVASLVVMR
eukprot:2289468-Prorocentrum_lima.AAC.1